MKKIVVRAIIFIAIIVFGIVLVGNELTSLLSVQDYIMKTSMFVFGFGLIGLGAGSLIMNECSQILGNNSVKLLINVIGLLEALFGLILIIWSFFI